MLLQNFTWFFTFSDAAELSQGKAQKKWGFFHNYIILSFLFIGLNVFDLTNFFSLCEEIDPKTIDSLHGISLGETSKIAYTIPWEGAAYFTGSMAACCLISLAGGFVPACYIASVVVTKIFITTEVVYTYTGAERMTKIIEIEEMQKVLEDKYVEAFSLWDPNSVFYEMLSDFYRTWNDVFMDAVTNKLERFKEIPSDVPCSLSDWKILEGLAEIVETISRGFM